VETQPKPSPKPIGTIVLLIAAGLFCIALAGMIVSSLVAAASPSAEEQALAQAREERLQEEERMALRQEAEAFVKLGPDSTLADYLRYLPGGDSRSREALAGARRVKSRQTDAVTLLNHGRLDALSDLFRLDLQVTPEFCQAYDHALANAAANVTRTRSDYFSVALELEQQMPNLEWLVRNGCNLNASLGLLVDHLHAASDSDRMETFAARVSALKR
jgi:hypothetical protein